MDWLSAVDVLMEAADGEYLADSGSGNLGYDTSMAENVLSLLFVLFIVGVIVVSLVSRRGGGAVRHVASDVVWMVLSLLYIC